MFRRDYLCIRWSGCEHLSYSKWSRIRGKNGAGHIALFRVIHDKSGMGPLFCTKCSVQRFLAANEHQLKTPKFLKWDRFISPSWRNTEYRTIVVFFFFFYTNSLLTQWFLVSFASLYRQIQRLRNLKGAKCEEHHHQRPWGPAMLGTGLHVVSVIAPVSPVCALVTRISSALGAYCSEFMLENVYFWLHLHVGWGDSSS